MTLEEFVLFVNELEENDQAYILPRLQRVLERITVSHVIKLQNLYNRVTTKNPENFDNPFDYMSVYKKMGDWCGVNCKGDFGAITVTNWGFELPGDAMRFRLTWDRSNYDDLAL